MFVSTSLLKPAPSEFPAIPIWTLRPVFRPRQSTRNTNSTELAPPPGTRAPARYRNRSPTNGAGRPSKVKAATPAQETVAAPALGALKLPTASACHSKSSCLLREAPGRPPRCTRTPKRAKLRPKLPSPWWLRTQDPPHTQKGANAYAQHPRGPLRSTNSKWLALWVQSSLCPPAKRALNGQAPVPIVFAQGTASKRCASCVALRPPRPQCAGPSFSWFQWGNAAPARDPVCVAHGTTVTAHV